MSAPDEVSLNAREHALVASGNWLRSCHYSFITITPESHARVVARQREASSLRDVFGWNLGFTRALLPAAIFDALRKHGWLRRVDADRWCSRVRFSTLGNQLFVHSGFPTVDADSVFFGPDTYRFCALLQREVKAARRVVDMGCGSGAGGLSLSSVADHVVLADINQQALSFARVNAELAGVGDRTGVVMSDLFSNVTGEFDLVIANPPYLVDIAKRTYRDGGGELGIDLGLRMVEQGLSRVSRGGRVILYTGSPVVDGIDQVKRSLERVASEAMCEWTYEELDPDVFGEELSSDAYAAVDRIAVVAASFRRT